MKIVDISVELVDKMGDDVSIVNAARVSFAKESDWEEVEVDSTLSFSLDGIPFKETQKSFSGKDQKLITYLAKHNHWSPFAHAFLSFRIKAPIFLARQFVKHQVGLSWNEVSRRYVSEEPEFWFPEVWRAKADNVKQGSSEESVVGESLWAFANHIEDVQSQTEEALHLYNHLLAQGVCAEQARMILPQNTMTTWIWSGSLMAFARVVNQRTGEGAQKEASELASKIEALVPQEFKNSWGALRGLG